MRHGKGPCNACSGRVKTKLTNLVKSQTCVINSARSCYDAAKEHIESKWPDRNECAHYLITIHFTPKQVEGCPGYT